MYKLDSEKIKKHLIQSNEYDPEAFLDVGMCECAQFGKVGDFFEISHDEVAPALPELGRD